MSDAAITSEIPTMFRLIRPLILASNSPRRRGLLKAMGIACEVVSPPEWAEPLPLAGETPERFAARAAKAKADAVYAAFENKDVAVLGADTVVFRGALILGKPADTNSAFAFLRELAGDTHLVRTACHLRIGHDKGISFHGEARVSMGKWSDEALHAYAMTGEGLDKAGAYAVQGLGAFLVESLSGSWSAVVGLPIAETVGVLLEQGIIEVVLSRK